MAKFSHYAVKVGRRTGIFRRWFGAGQAHEQIYEYPNAKFKGFHSEGDARAWLNSGNEVLKRYDKLVDKLVAGDNSVLPELEKTAKVLTKPAPKDSAVSISCVCGCKKEIHKECIGCTNCGCTKYEPDLPF